MNRKVDASVVDETIGAAALQLIDQLDPGDLLAAVTPEQIGVLTGYSPSSIRYRLNAAGERRSAGAPGAPAKPRGWGFDREQLLVSAIGAHRTRVRPHRAASAARYAASLETLAAGSAEALGAALEADVAVAVDGASERPLLVALATASHSPDVARALRELEDDHRTAFDPIVARGLAILGRTLRPEASITGLQTAISHHVMGVARLRRADPTASAGLITGVVLAIVAAHTIAVGELSDTDVRDADHASLHRPPPPR